GEEIQALARAGIECEIVNGITAGLAAATAAGVPLTHRDYTKGVAFVTAHAGDDRGPDWAALAKSRMTLVIYMGVSRVAAIQRALLEAGLPPSTPAVAVESATLPGERGVATSLGRLGIDLAIHEIESPAIMVIGEVV